MVLFAQSRGEDKVEIKGVAYARERSQIKRKCEKPKERNKKKEINKRTFRNNNNNMR